MKQYKMFSRFLIVLLPILSLTIHSCDSCNPKDKTSEDGVVYQDVDTNTLYDIEDISNESNLEIMFTRVPGDPDTGIVIRKIKDSGNHHERVIKGTVLRGTYRVDSPGFSRTFLYGRYNSDSGCRESHWYSWVKPSIEVAPFGGRFRKRTYSRSIKTATGLPFKFDKWNKDYQKRWVDSVNAAKKRAGLPPFPKISPSDSLKDGYPYMPLPTPEGTGFLDAPIFARRLSGNNTASLAEQLFAQFGRLPRCRRSDNMPSPDSGVIRFTTQGQTYLYCIDRVPECLGYFTWTNIETDTIVVRWVQGTAADCGETISMGLSNGKIWVPRTFFRGGTTITVGPWTACP